MMMVVFSFEDWLVLGLSATLALITVGSGGGEGVAKILTRDVFPTIYD